MAQVPIIMPQLGESIAEATVVNFLISLGDEVEADQDLIEVETNKATMNVPAPCPGRVERIVASQDQSLPVGAVLGYLEVTEEVARRYGVDQKGPESGDDEGGSSHHATGEETSEQPERTYRVEPTVRGLPVPAHAQGASYLSPRLKARMNELGLHAADLAGVAGSGAGGRVTVQDFERFISELESHKLTTASSMRVAVADAMRRSWTRPLATVALPFSLEALLAHRKRCDPRPGPGLYAVRALGLALCEQSELAGRLIGHKIAHPRAIDIGVAVEAEEGVLVPVLRQVDQTPLSDLIAPYNQLIRQAKDRKLSNEATGGSIATVTNFGTFGLTWATPIPLPEQTLVLGMGAGRKVPRWDEEKEQFVPVTEANLTLSFDHRVLDGGAAGRLLSRVGKLMEDPASL